MWSGSKRECFSSSQAMGLPFTTRCGMSSVSFQGCLKLVSHYTQRAANGLEWPAFVFVLCLACCWSRVDGIVLPHGSADPALYEECICVRGICDLQLMQLATRGDRRYVNGLAKCIENDSTLTLSEKLQWQVVKRNGCELFDPNRGGDYAVFENRPLSQEILDYSTQDVAHMPDLWNVYRPKLCDAWWDKITEETERRIKQSQAKVFNGKGRHMAEAPAGWRYWQPTPAQKRTKVLLESQCSRETGEKASVSVHRTVDLADLLHSMSFRDDDPFEREAEDFAACDSECGYCGACLY